MSLGDDRPRSEQLRTQRGPFDPADLDEDGVFSVTKWLSRRDEAWEREHRDRERPWICRSVRGMG
jgi:hypothetical protein